MKTKQLGCLCYKLAVPTHQHLCRSPHYSTLQNLYHPHNKQCKNNAKRKGCPHYPRCISKMYKYLELPSLLDASHAECSQAIQHFEDSSLFHFRKWMKRGFPENWEGGKELQRAEEHKDVFALPFQLKWGHRSCKGPRPSTFRWAFYSAALLRPTFHWIFFSRD